MKKYKLKGTGWERYTGYLGSILFEDGVNQTEMLPKDVARIGANLLLEEIDTNLQVGPSVNIRTIMDIGAPLEAEKVEVIETPKKVTEVVKFIPEKLYTREELEKIADEDGIKGLRSIASSMEVKGTQINQLISGILNYQNSLETRD